MFLKCDGYFVNTAHIVFAKIGSNYDGQPTLSIYTVLATDPEMGFHMTSDPAEVDAGRWWLERQVIITV